MITSDFDEYQETGRSFILDKLLHSDLTEDEAFQKFYLLAIRYSGAAAAYLDAFEQLGIEPMFDTWSQVEGNFEQAKHDLEKVIDFVLADEEEIYSGVKVEILH